MYAAFVRRFAWLGGAALLTACGGASQTSERNPSFAQGRIAAAPVVTYPVLNCGDGSNTTVDDTLRAVLEKRGANNPSRASLVAAPEIRAQLCDFLKSEAPQEAALYTSGSKAETWRVPSAMSAGIRKLSEANGATTNVFVVTQQLESCSSLTRAEGGEAICSKTSTFIVHSLVFNAKSELLWNGSERIDADRTSETNRGLQALVGRIPAAFGEPEPVSTTTTTAAQVPALAAPEEPTIPTDVPVIAGRKTAFRQSTLKGNAKTGYALAMLEGEGGGKSSIVARLPGKLVTGKPMPVTVSSIQIKDATCTATGTLTFSSLPTAKKGSSKVAVGTLSLSAQCPDGHVTVEGPIKAEVQR